MGRKPTYSQEFKDGAVRLSLEEGKTVRDVAKELKISEITLVKWRSAAGVSTSRGDSQALRDARREIEELKRQNKALEKEKRVVEIEREILKNCQTALGVSRFTRNTVGLMMRRSSGFGRLLFGGCTPSKNLAGEISNSILVARKRPRVGK